MLYEAMRSCDWAGDRVRDCGRTGTWFVGIANISGMGYIFIKKSCVMFFLKNGSVLVVPGGIGADTIDH